METFLNTLLGGMHPQVFLALWLLAMVGSFFRVAYRADKQRKNTRNTPVRFSLRFFWWNNILKFTLCILGNAIGILMLNVQFGTTAAAVAAFGVGFIGGHGTIFLSKLRDKAPKQ